MNEKNYRKIIGVLFLVLVSIIIVQSIVYNTALRRADITIGSLNRELSEARARVSECSRELEDCTGTISQCHDAVGRIADNFRDDRAELQDIIGNLRTVREEIENMENALNFFYDKYGYIDNSFSNNGSE